MMLQDFSDNDGLSLLAPKKQDPNKQRTLMINNL